MAHELTVNKKTQRAEMAYAGDTPWHGLGQQLTKGASIEAWTESAGMNWKINRSRVRYGEGDNQQIDEQHHVLFRSDCKSPLGIVSPKFKIVQPRDVLEFFRDLVGANGFELETAGTLFGGRRFWALASIGESAVINAGSDIVGGYLLLCTGADGTLATTARFTTVRVVCNNTLSMSLSSKDKNEVVVSHRSHFKPAEIKDRLGIARGEFKKFVGAMRELSKVAVDAKTADAMTVHLLNEPAKVEAAKKLGQTQELLDKTRASKGYAEIMRLFGGQGKGAQLPGAKDTAWGWVNAVTEHVDYQYGTKKTDDSRLNGAWFDRGDDTKTRAVELALTLTA